MKGKSLQERSFSSLLPTDNNDFEEEENGQKKPSVLAKAKTQWGMLSKKKKIAVVVGVLGAIVVIAGIVGVVVGLSVKKPPSEEPVMVVSPNVTETVTPPVEAPTVIVPVVGSSACANATAPYSDDCVKEWWYLSGCRSTYASDHPELREQFLQNATIEEILTKFEIFYNRAVIGEGSFEMKCNPIPAVLKEALECRRALDFICDCNITVADEPGDETPVGSPFIPNSHYDAPRGTCLMHCWAKNMTEIRPYCPLNPVLEHAIVCHDTLATVCESCIRWTPTMLRLNIGCMNDCLIAHNETVKEKCPIAPSVIQVTLCKHAVANECFHCIKSTEDVSLSYNDSLCLAYCWQEKSKVLEGTCPVPRPVQEALDCQYVVRTECPHCLGDHYYDTNTTCIQNCIAELPATTFRPGMRCEVSDDMQRHINCSRLLYDVCSACQKITAPGGEHGHVEHMSAFEWNCLQKCWDENLAAVNGTCSMGVDQFLTNDALFILTGIFGSAATPAAVYSFISSLFPGITHGIASSVQLDPVNVERLYDQLYPKMTLSIVIGLLFPDEGLEQFIWDYYPPDNVPMTENATVGEAFVAELNAVFSGSTDIKPSQTMAGFLSNLNDMFAPLSAGRATINVVLPDNETVQAWTDLPMFYKVILWFSLPRSAAEVEAGQTAPQEFSVARH